MKVHYRHNRRLSDLIRPALCLCVIALLVAADQAVKQLVVQKMRFGDIPVLGSFLHLYYAENTGAAFSMLPGQTWLLSAVNILLICACLVLLFLNRLKGTLADAALILICSGGLGNLVDRLFRGYVVDYIYLKVINFAIFNLADSFVVVGVCLLALYLLLFDQKSRRRGVFR